MNNGVTVANGVFMGLMPYVVVFLAVFLVIKFYNWYSRSKRIKKLFSTDKVVAFDCKGVPTFVERNGQIVKL